MSDLITAMRDHAEGRGLGPLPPAGELMATVEPGARPLHPDDSVASAAIVSGETVSLRLAPLGARPPGQHPAPPPPAGTPGLAPGPSSMAIAIDISTGPSAGLFKLLQPGRYAIGRGAECTLRVDDPTVSRLHVMVDITPDLGIHVHTDPNATNGTQVNGQFIAGSYTIQPGDRIVIGSTEFAFWPVQPDESRIRDRLGQIPFNRVPYKRPAVRPRPFEKLDNPPEEPDKKSFPIGLVILPLFGAIAIVSITGRVYFLIFAVLSPLMMAYRRYYSGKEGNRKYQRQRADFLERIERREAEINAALAAEQRERYAAAPDVAELARQAQLHLPRLWERNRGAADLLSLRVGLGDQPSLITQELPAEGHNELRDEAARRLAHARIIRHVPVVVDMDRLGAVGLFHDVEQVHTLGSSLVVQAACLHSPEDLVLTAAIASENLSRWTWLKWLPHTRTATSPLEGDHLVVDSDDLNRLMVNLLKVANTRLEARRKPEEQWPRILLVIDEDADPDRAILAQLLDVAPNVGIVLLWLGRTEFQLPRQCRGIVRCVAPHQGASVFRDTDPEVDDQFVMTEGITPQTAASIARTLAPIRDASATSLTTAIPRKVLLLDALGMPEPGPQEIARRWSAAQTYSLAAPLGTGADGTFSLDLVEHGPHALIAGTSGAGKSELLQTLVASLAAHHPPERLNFLFIDYKGGAAAAPFEPLPHTVGAVTNLAAQLSLRALTSLRAELNRRMAVMEGRAKDLQEMLEVAPAEAPPSLVIVVDEFATLVKEIPDFVAGIVDIAQRGRSLGIHLVLATQRPTGSVNDNILANTNLRMSLRVLDPADSSAIIGTRDAADIPVPLRGRAYARSGPAAIHAFQCAWSGAPYEPVQTAASVTARSFPFGSQAQEENEKAATRSAPQAGPPGEEPPAPPTHLDVIVRSCAEAADALQKPQPRRPWVEPLPEVVVLDDVVAQLPASLRSDPGRYAVVGVSDRPEHQSQQAEAIDLEASGGLLVFGTGGAGKTTTLRTIAAGMAGQADPDGVQIFGLDFAGRSLNQLSELPHTVTVANTDDQELITRMFTVFRKEINRRRDLLAEHRAESLSALRKQRNELVLPRWLVMLDGYGNFHSTFDKGDLYGWQKELQSIVADGRQVGIHAVFSADRRQGFPAALFSALGARLALRMSTPEELSGIGVPAKVARSVDLADGRGFLNGVVELQVACVSEDPSGSAQAEALAKIGMTAAARTQARATPLPELPEAVTIDQAPSGRLKVPIGLTDMTMAVAEIDLARQNLVITGPPMSGRSLAVATAAHALGQGPNPPALVAIGGPNSPLAEQPGWTHSGFTRSQVVPALEAAVELVGDDETTDVRLILCIDAAEDVDGPDRNKLLEKLAKSDAVRLVVAVDPATVGKAYSGWMGELRRNRAVLFLQPGPRGDVEQLAGIRPSLRPSQPLPPGRGVLVANRGWSLVQVSLPPGVTV